MVLYFFYVELCVLMVMIYYLFQVVESTKFEVVDEYVYLGQIIRLGKSNFDREVNRRVQLGCAAFGKLRHIFSSGITVVLPVMTYGSETWSFTAGRMRKLKVAQRAMKRAMLGVFLRDKLKQQLKQPLT